LSKQTLDVFMSHPETPRFCTMMEEAKYRVGIKHALRRLGVDYAPELCTVGLEKLLQISQLKKEEK
jgi:hypothetical protein